MFFILLAIFIFFHLYKNISIPSDIKGDYLITDVYKYENNNKYFIKKGIHQYIFYSNEDFLSGDKIFISGDVKDFEIFYTPGAFDKNKYYFSRGVHGEIKNYQIKKLNQTNYFYSLKNLIKDPILKVFLGSEILDDSKNLISSLNIYYLLSLGGIHIYLLLSIIDRILFNLNFSVRRQENIKIAVIMLFLLFSGFKTTILRITIYQCLKSFKREYYNNITNYTLMNLSFLITSLIRPYLMFNKSYFIAYLIVSFLLLFRELISSNNFFIMQIKTNFLVNLVLIPFYQKVNLLSIILTPIYYLLIVNLLFPLSIVNNFINIKIISKINNTVLKTLSITNLGKYNFKFLKLNNYLVFCYLVLLVFVIISKNYKKLIGIILLFLVVISPGLKKYYQDEQLYFLDVGQGDSSVYLSKDKVIVIDAFRNVQSFLEYEGIRTIDYLIITHEHLDHMMELFNLINNFHVKNIIKNPYFNLTVDKNINVINAQSGTLIKEKRFSLKFYGPLKDYNSSNNNSLVFKLITPSYCCLFTGDIENIAEMDLVKNYNNDLKSDYLKISHHGSETSSNYQFIKAVSPSDAIISVGRNNQYGFPSKKTIETLNQFKITVIRTDLNGTIKVNKDNQIIKYKK